MAPRTFRLEPEDLAELQREFDDHLRSGGSFLAGVTGMQENEECTLVLVHPVDAATMSLAARAVWIATDGPQLGVGVTLLDFSADLREAIRRFIVDHGAETAPPAEPPSESAPKQASRHDRLRQLSTTEQLKIARGTDSSDRLILERIYGKSVWPALLNNPRLTVPEVARLARKANMPRPLLELIVANGGWLQSGQVRRALFSNPPPTTEMIVKVLRLMPKHELKLVPSQTTYPTAVRNTARRLFKI